MKERTEVKNANETWHATKGIAKALKGITSGPKNNHGKTWHAELSDKAAAIKTATYHAMKTCDGSSEKLRQNLDNICEHYKGNHENCSDNSRCKKEENYVCSNSKLKDPFAMNLLSSAIKKLQVYRTPEDYVACVDTHYVESYNNATLIYHDKMITFGEKEYKRRICLSIIDWNENVDRECTSIVHFEDAKNPRKRDGHKNLKPKSYSFFMGKNMENKASAKHKHYGLSDVKYMMRVMRRTVFGASDQVRYKPGCISIEDGYRLRVSH